MGKQKPLDTSKVKYMPKALEDWGGESAKNDPDFEDNFKFQYAKLPMFQGNISDQIKLGRPCNTCKWRSEKMGGNGACNLYKEDAVCEIAQRTYEAMATFTARSPQALVDLLEVLVKHTAYKLMIGEHEANLSGEDNTANYVKRLDKLVNTIWTGHTLSAPISSRAFGILLYLASIVVAFVFPMINF